MADFVLRRRPDEHPSDNVELGELYRGASRPLTPAETKGLYTVAGAAAGRKDQE